MSDWERVPLSVRQLNYAALDAWAGREVLLAIAVHELLWPVVIVVVNGVLLAKIGYRIQRLLGSRNMVPKEQDFRGNLCLNPLHHHLLRQRSRLL